MKVSVYGQDRDVGADFDDYFDPKHTAVISIDMHRGHLEDSPDCPCPAPRGREIIAPINRFHEQARSVGVRVVHVKAVLRSDGSDDLNGLTPAAWRRTFPLYVGDIPNARAHALEGSQWTQWMTNVAPSDLRVENKRRLSAFYPTDLDFLLRNQGVHTVVFDGIMADCCVLNAAFDACNLGYKVVIVKDLVRGTDAHLEAAALSMASLHLGLVVDAATAVNSWRAAGARQAVA